MHRHTIAGLALATTLTGALTATAAISPAHADQPGATRAAAYSLTIAVKDDEPVVGDKVKIKGKVSPAAPGARVTLQVRYQDQKRWKTIGSDTLNGSSAYKFKDKVESVRKRKYRVVKAASPQHAAGSSPRAKVTVYGWRLLTSLVPAIQNGIYETDKVAINGLTYVASVSATSYQTPATASIDYNLNRDCKELAGRFGLSDSSPAGSSATVSLTADGVSEFSGTFGLTQSTETVLDVTNAFRITVTSAQTGGGLGVVGAPQVLCSF